MQFAAAVALIFYHERCRNIDQETIDTYVLQLDEREDQASDRDLITAATFLWHTQQLKRAGQVVQKIIDVNPTSLTAHTLKGWIYLSASKEDLQNKALQYFEHVLNEDEGGNRKFLEALLGRAKVFEKMKKYEDCMEVLSEISVCYPGFQPVGIEKAKVHIYSGEWDQALESITAVMVRDKKNVEALRIYLFYLLARENDPELVSEKFDELIAALKATEGRNADLFYNISRLFARFCGRREYVLTKTMEMLNIAVSLQPENAVYMCELGHQMSMGGDWNNAYATFQQATALDESFWLPLYGMIYCRIKQEMMDDAVQQLEFLAEIGDNQGKYAEHPFLEAMLEWRLKGNKTEAIRMLDSALNVHIQQPKAAATNLEFYIKLNADFLMQLAQEYLIHCGAKPKISSAGPPKHLIKAIKLLENVTKQN